MQVKYFFSIFPDISITYNKELNRIVCHGIQIAGVEITKSPKRPNVQSPLLETMQFIHYDNNWDTPMSLQKSLTIALDIILQNCYGTLRELTICEVDDDHSNSELVNHTKEILSRKPFTVTNFIQTDLKNTDEKFDLILLDGTFNNLSLFQFLNEDGFIILKSPCRYSNTDNSPMEIIFSSQMENSHLFLLRKCKENPKKHFVSNLKINDFHWLGELQDHIENSSANTVYLIGRQNETNGLMGLVNCLNKEGTGCKFRVVISDENFSYEKDIFKKQLKKDLVLSILKKGKWGTYVYLPLEDIGTKLVHDATVDIIAVGNLSSLTWMQTPPIYHQ